MEKPVIELKGIKHSGFASQETHCYTATLYVDGQKWGTVGNDGHGGPDYYHAADRSKIEAGGYGDILALNKRIEATMPQVECFGSMLTQNLDMICGDLVNEFLMDRDFNRAMKAKLLFTQADKPGVLEIKPSKGVSVAQAAEHARRARPDWKLLLDLPPAEARAIYFAIPGS